MKKVKFIFVLALASCIQPSPFSKSQQLIGNWEMIEFELDEIVVDDENVFTNTTFAINRNTSQTSFSTLGSRKSPCNHPFPLFFSHNEDFISFNTKSSCDTLNKIDPFFYKTQDTSYNGISGDWNFEYFNKRMFILNNENHSRKHNIRIIFEKTK